MSGSGRLGFLTIFAASFKRPFDYFRIFSGRRAEASGVRPGSYSSKIQTIGVPARLYRHISVTKAEVVIPTRKLEKLKLIRAKRKEPFVQSAKPVRCPFSMLRVSTLVETFRIMKNAEKFDNPRIRPGFMGQTQPDGTNSAPVMDAMNTIPIEPELILDVFD
ncbi:hypothetical protein ACFLQW_03715 [Candidatus Zixiibacteriota bacterium]